MERIGFIGLGIMGKPMAEHLVKSGYEVTVHNRSVAAVDALVQLGAKKGTSPRLVAEQSDVVITMLPDSPDVQKVLLGSEGVLQNLSTGAAIIDMTTASPVLARRIAEEAKSKGIAFMDAPVSGGEVGAQNGTLSIMVGASAETFDRLLPILEKMGKNIVHVGDVGAGQVAKAANQVIVALTIEAVSEGLLLASRAGVDPAMVRQALLGGFASSRILELHGQRMLDRNFNPGFKAILHRKDLGIALETGKAFGVPLPATAMAHEMFNALVASGDAEKDHSAILNILEKLAGAEMRVGVQK